MYDDWGANEQQRKLLDNTERLERTGKNLTEGYRVILETEQIGAAVLQDLSVQRETIQRSRGRVSWLDFIFAVGLTATVPQTFSVIVATSILMLGGLICRRWNEDSLFPSINLGSFGCDQKSKTIKIYSENVVFKCLWF